MTGISIAWSRRHVAACAGFLAAINCVFLLGTAVTNVQLWGAELGWLPNMVLRETNLAIENVLAAWYSSMLLLLVCLASLACLSVDLRAAESSSDRRLSYGWLLVALSFALLSFDELGSIHERIKRLIPIFGDSSLTWPLLLAVPIGAVAVFLILFALTRARRNRLALGLTVVGVLLFVSVPVQEHFETWQRPTILLLLEEGAEIFGSLCFLTAYGFYALGVAGRRKGAVPMTGARAGIHVPGDVVALIALGLALCAVAVAAYLTLAVPEGVLADERGRPMNWFPSASAFLAGMLFLAIWRAAAGEESRQVSPWPLLYLGVGTYCVLLSATYGAEIFSAAKLWPGSPRRQAAIMGVTLLGAFVLAAGLAVRSRSRVRALAAVTWPVLLVLSFLVHDAVGAVLGTFGNSALLASPFLVRLQARSVEKRGD